MRTPARRSAPIPKHLTQSSGNSPYSRPRETGVFFFGGGIVTGGILVYTGASKKRRERTVELTKWGRCLTLFLKFCKIGAFTFGGGYAMIPLIRREIALREGWIEDKDLLDILAVSESTPGPIAVNTATFVGYRVAGRLGAAVATVGVVLPSFLIIFALSFVLRQFEDLAAVRYAFWGIRVAVVALVLSALVSMARQCPWNAVSCVLAAGAFVLVGFFGANSILVLVACALIGLGASRWKVGGMKL